MSSRRKPGKRAVHESALAYDGVDPKSRVERIRMVLTNSEIAEILGVSPSQPSRWRSGKDRVSAELLSVVVDLDYICSRLLAEFDPVGARDWLYGNEPFLRRARPIDAMILRGPMALLPALDGIRSDGYA